MTGASPAPVSIGVLTSFSAAAICAAAAALPGVAARPLDSAPGPGERLDALIVSNDRYGPGVRDAAARNPGIRWVHCTSAGTDRLERFGVPPGVTVTRGPASGGAVVAEHAVALLLALARRLPDAERGRQERRWQRQAIRPQLSSLRGSEAVIAGLGTVGTEVARRLRPFGARVTGIVRDPARQRPPGTADRVAGPAGLRDALALADSVIVCLPLTARTEGIIGAAELAAVKPGARLVNVGRGGLVDETALAAACRSGHLSGIGLDVFADEPLPAGSPLWDLPNAVLTPHVAGNGDPAHLEAVTAAAVAGIERFRDGLPLPGLLTLTTAQEDATWQN